MDAQTAFRHFASLLRRAREALSYDFTERIPAMVRWKLKDAKTRPFLELLRGIYGLFMATCALCALWVFTLAMTLRIGCERLFSGEDFD